MEKNVSLLKLRQDLLIEILKLLGLAGQINFLDVNKLARKICLTYLQSQKQFTGFKNYLSILKYCRGECSCGYHITTNLSKSLPKVKLQKNLFEQCSGCQKFVFSCYIKECEVCFSEMCSNCIPTVWDGRVCDKCTSNCLKCEVYINPNWSIKCEICNGYICPGCANSGELRECFGSLDTVEKCCFLCSKKCHRCNDCIISTQSEFCGYCQDLEFFTK
jgi:hypothetical protein